METTIEKKVEPVFINKKFLTYEQLTNPDYRLNQLQKLYGNNYSVSCSRCHHCR